MVAEFCQYVIIGHSERRAYFGETDETVNRRVKAALGSSLIPVMCVGETLDENEARQVPMRSFRARCATAWPVLEITGPPPNW